jgi:hypothetical protein
VVLSNSDPRNDAKAVDSSLGLRYAACLRHTPPFRARNESFVFCSMLHAHSSLQSLISTILDAVSFDLCPIPHAHSSFLS